MDELEWLKAFAAAMVNPLIDISTDETMAMFGEPPLITDAKSLYDAARSVSSGLRLSEKRTAIEVTIVRERLEALHGPDGLTKPTARDNFAEQLRHNVHQLKYDPMHTAAKKLVKTLENKNVKNTRQCRSSCLERLFLVKLSRMRPFVLSLDAERSLRRSTAMKNT